MLVWIRSAPARTSSRSGRSGAIDPCVPSLRATTSGHRVVPTQARLAPGPAATATCLVVSRPHQCHPVTARQATVASWSTTMGRRLGGAVGAKGGATLREVVDGGGSGVKWSAVEERGQAASCRAGGGELRMFFGTYTPKLDDKGRLFLPAKFRDQLAEGLVVTQRSGALPLRLARRRSSSASPSGSGGAGLRPRRRVTTSGCSSPAPPTRRPTSRAASRSRRAAGVGRARPRTSS